MKPADRSKLYAEAMSLASRAQGTVLALRSNGVELNDVTRAELLAKAVARQEVRLTLDLESYEQASGVHNRNHVRFRDGAMLRIGGTGKHNPYMRDHRQGDVTARGGTVLVSKTTKLAEGHYKIEQAVELTEPSAVERALRGLMSSVSIAWNPIGPVVCTACRKPVLARNSCWHWPGDSIQVGEQAFIVEWEFDDAELIETSEVSVPGVPSAGITGIRAALAALSGGAELPTIGDDESQEHNRMSLKLALLALPALALAATAGDDEVLSAVKNAFTERDQLAAKLDVAEGERKRLAVEVAGYRATEAKHAENDFIATALASGRIAPVDEKAWRKLFAVDAKGAAESMAERPAGCATPVGLPRQTDKKEPAGGATALTPTQLAMLEQMGMTEAEYRAALAKGGVS